MAATTGASAEELAQEYEEGEEPCQTSGGQSGKQRTKQEQHEHKRPSDPQSDTRKMVTNAMNAEEKRKEEERIKNEKKEKPKGK